MKKDFLPWMLLPGIMLTLSGVTLLAPRQAALAAPPAPARQAPKEPVYDDGDGDELLEHWGDPQFSREAERQMAGMGAGFVLLGTLALSRRSRKKHRCAAVPLPSQSDFLKLAPRPALAIRTDTSADVQTDTRKAA
jgi:hypothetical protein